MDNKKIYLEVAHLEDSDSDYFSFSSLSEAIKYIEKHLITDFALSDQRLNTNIPEDDYTFISERQ